jgi:hypothetical protein
VWRVADLAHDQRGRILARAPVKRERHNGAIGDRSLLGAGFPCARAAAAQVVHLVGALAQRDWRNVASRVFGGMNAAIPVRVVSALRGLAAALIVGVVDLGLAGAASAAAGVLVPQPRLERGRLLTLI